MQAVKRTTVSLKPDLYRRLRQAALDQDQTLQEIVNEALERHLGAIGGKRTGATRFRTFRLGKVKGRLTREEIYRDR